MIHSVIRLPNVDPGFDPTNLVRVDLYAHLPGEREIRPDVKRQFFGQIAERFAALPGVERVGIACSQTDAAEYLLDGSDQPVTLVSVAVGVGADDPLRAMRAPLLAGRYFDAPDQAKGQKTVIVNETLARLCWPGQDPIGRTLRFARDRDWVLQVVGVVGDVKDETYRQPTGPTYYRPLEHYHILSLFWYSVLVRTRADPAAIIPVLRHEIKAAAPGLRMPSFRVVQESLYDSTADERAYMSYLSGFAAIGLFLSMIGIYGMLAGTVARRTKEIGIRMALGGGPGRILGLVLREGMVMIVTGLVLGIAGALALTRVISSFLYEVSPTDPATFAVVALFLIAVSLLACYLPARGATKVDPMVALRYE